jgi:phage terminase large subunit-like protein
MARLHDSAFHLTLYSAPEDADPWSRKATRDLSALVIVWQDGTGAFHVKPYCWLPGDMKERSEQDHAPHDAWARLGCITPIGPTTDPKVIAHKIAEINGRNHIMSLVFDLGASMI